jgi:hypothetical protein
LPAKNGSKGSGIIALPEKDTECAFTYTVEENTLQLCFDNTYITDATYTFTVERDNLTLFGGDGTTGGTYALMRVIMIPEIKMSTASENVTLKMLEMD